MKKAAVVAVLLVCLGVIGWRLVDLRGSPSGDEGAPAPPVGEASTSARLAAAAPGRAPTLGPAVDLSAVDRDLDLHGTIVREDGSPVAGAEVVSLSYPARRTNLYFTGKWYDAVPSPSTRSAADGTFRLRLRRGERVDLRVSAADAATQERPDCLAGERVRIVLSPAASLVVVVRDGDGTPVAGTRLRLVRLPVKGDITFVRTAQTGADGSARFDDLPGPTRATLEVTPALLGSPKPISVRIPRAAQEDVEVILPAGRKITGRVTDATTGLPIAGAVIGMGWQQDRAVRADTDGRYALLGWTGDDESEIHALADGYGREGFVVGSASAHDFVLEAGSVVVGRLVNAAGDPLPQAWVLAAAGVYEAPRKESYRWGRTGLDGRFRLDGLRRDLAHTLISLAEGYGRTLLDFDPPPKAGEPLDLGDVRLPSGQRIEGRVTNLAGEGIARTTVTLWGANADRTRLRPSEPALAHSYGARDVALTDDIGRFRFADLSPGAYTLTARPDGEPEVKSEVALAAGQDALGVELRGERGPRLRVTVVDGAGHPVPGIRVVTDSYSGPQLGATTDSDGIASFPAAARSQRIRVEPGYGEETRYVLPKPKQVAAGATEFRIAVARAGVVAGRVTDPGGAPAAGVHVEARSEGAVTAETWADGQGRFELVVSEERAVDLSLSGRMLQGGRLLATPLFGTAASVAPGTKDVSIRATIPATDRRLRVVVLDPAGESAPSQISVGPEWAGWGGLAANASVTTKDGVFELEDLPARPVQLMAGPARGSKGWGRWMFQSVGPVMPEAQTVTVRLVEGVRVTGSVLRPDGTPSRGARVSGEREGAVTRLATAGEDGRFSLLLDPTGGLLLTLQAHDAQDDLLEATEEGVREGSGEIVLRLARIR